MAWLLFDYAGVVGEHPHTPEAAELVEVAGAAADEFWATYWRNRRPYDLDELTAEGYWRTVATDLGYHWDHARVAELRRLDAASWLRARPEVVALAETLGLSARFKPAVLSDAPRDFANALRRSDLATVFPTMLFSCDLGYAKPDAGCFEEALTRIDAEPPSVFFVDDSDRNVAAAEELGIRAIHFTGWRELRRELTERVEEPYRPGPGV